MLDDVGFCVIMGLPNIITNGLFFTYYLNSYCSYGENIIAFQIYQATVSLLNNLPLFVTTVSIKSPNKITPLGMALQQQGQEITHIMLIADFISGRNRWNVFLVRCSDVPYVKPICTKVPARLVQLKGKWGLHHLCILICAVCTVMTKNMALCIRK